LLAFGALTLLAEAEEKRIHMNTRSTLNGIVAGMILVSLAAKAQERVMWVPAPPPPYNAPLPTYSLKVPVSAVYTDGSKHTLVDCKIGTDIASGLGGVGEMEFAKSDLESLFAEEAEGVAEAEGLAVSGAVGGVADLYPGGAASQRVGVGGGNGPSAGVGAGAGRGGETGEEGLDTTGAQREHNGSTTGAQREHDGNTTGTRREHVGVVAGVVAGGRE
jgi:hypothetical protein